MLRSVTESILNALWYEGKYPWLGGLLTPLEHVYTLLAKRKWRKYAAQRTESLPIPVVVVGNIVAGGSGKTPVTQALAIALKQRGVNVGIVSRGYGGTVTAATVVDASQPQRFGDEPCLLAQITQCPVVVAKIRRDGVMHLYEHFAVDIVLSDDGMQHSGLHRDFEICVIGARGVGNGRGLPAGPMREPLTRLGKVETVLTWGVADSFVPKTVPQWQIFGSHEPLQLLSGSAAPEGTLQNLALLQTMSKMHLYAAAGLAHPARFYVSLAGAGLVFKTLFVPDHGVLSKEQQASVPEHALLLVTQKDAVKLRQANLSAKLQRNIRIVPWSVTLPTVLVDAVFALLPTSFDLHRYES